MPKAFALFRPLKLLLPLFPALASPAWSQQPRAVSNTLAAAAPVWEVKSRDTHETQWQSVRRITNSVTGRVRSVTNTYVELATGLSFRDAEGSWRTSDPSFRITDRGAEATAGSHSAMLAADIGTAGSVTVRRGALTMQGHPLCVGYYDPVHGRRVRLAEITNAIGWLVDSNQVVWSNCFNGLRASIRIRNSLSGLESDLLLHERPPPPADFGFSDRTRLELFTEWVGDTPIPQEQTRVLQREKDPAIRQQMLEPDFTDSTLNFGPLRMPQGKAFSIGGDPAPEAAQLDAVPVSKRFEVISGRKILIEAVPVRQVQRMLDELPAFGGHTNAAIQPTASTNAVQLAGERPSIRQARTLLGAPKMERGANLSHLPVRKLPLSNLGQRMRTAFSSAEPRARHAELAAAPRTFVLDWHVLSSSTPSYTLRGDMTYLVSSTFSVDHLKMEGGCVVKVDNNVNAKIVVNNSVDCLGSAFRPILFTSRYDTSIGEDIPPAGPIPPNRLFWGLHLNAWNFSGPGKLNHLRISHAGVGVFIDWGTDWTLQDCQFVNCTYPISVSGTDINLKAFNLLVRGDKAYAPAFDSADGGILNAQHVTVHGVDVLAQGWDAKSFLNSLVVDLNYDPGTLGTGSLNLWNSTGTGIFESSAFGHHYLSALSPARNAGSATIDSQLLTEIRKKTTSTPLALASPISSPTTLAPRAILDADALDAGFHFPQVDYLANNVSLESTLTLKDGVVIGWRGDYAFRGGTVLATASPTKPNWVVHLAGVQESPTPESLQYGVRVGLEPAHAELQFTRFAMPRMPQESYHAGGWFADLLRLRSCEFFNAGLIHNKGGSMELNNCLLERLNVIADQDGYDVDTHLRNCLLKGVHLRVYQAAPVEVRDCVLWESTNSPAAGSIASSHNGYINSPVLYGSSGQDITGLSPSIFTPGPFGLYYQISSDLVNAGSLTDATLAGLFHYTTSTAAGSKEANSQLDIGMHFVAADATGQPLDTDNDGLADWREAEIGTQLAGPDTDGDGLSDGWEVLILATDPFTANGTPALNAVAIQKCPLGN